MNDVLFSSKSDEWSTPNDLFLELSKEFNFTLDPCATDENHKCSKYFTMTDDGLSKSWAGEVVFCNPPYSKIKQWVEKAYDQWFIYGVTTVMLIPARTDTKWFHEYIYNKHEVRFIRGRLHFNNSKNSAPFPSMIVIFRGNNYDV